MVFIKWLVTEMNIYKSLHFIKEVEHDFCPGSNCQLC